MESTSDLTIFVVLLVLVIIGLYMLVFVDKDTNVTSKLYENRFYQPIEQSIGVALLKPIVVSIFQRVSTSAADAAAIANGIEQYNERLVVVRPDNWLIYTYDGVNFQYVTNNINSKLSKCVLPNTLNAVNYRLKKINEKDDYVSEKLKFSCINYTMDQLVRIFGSYSYKTDIDLTDYFDKDKRPNAPLFTVESVLSFLVANSLV